MNTGCIRSWRAAWALLVLGVAVGSTSALAADKGTAADAQARYQQERAVCTSGQSNQDRATCLQEAGAAFAQARRDDLDDGPAVHYQRNALQRCEALSGDDRQACVARMQGQGTTSGSVAAGGIFRELVTRDAVQPIAPAK
jgi:hypothetical protein